MFSSMPLILMFLAAFASAQDASIQLLGAASLPSFSAACISALTANLSCNFIEIGSNMYQLNGNYTIDYLNSLCTPTCISSIATYRSNALKACSNDQYNDTSNGTVLGPPVAGGVYLPIVVPDYYFTNYNQRCLKDKLGTYCYTHLQNTTLQDPCDECGLKMFQAQLQNGYFYNTDLASDFSSLTSSCKVTTLTATTPSSVVITSATATATTPACAGRTVSIPSGSTCDSVAAANNISTWQLLSTNNLNGGCTNFPTSGSLCISGSCRTYKVSANDTCLSIANQFSITITQFQTWNPNLNRDCSNFAVTVGHIACVSNPQNFTLPTNTRALSTTAPTVAAPIPTDVVQGTNTKCGQYYHVIAGDTCAHITIMKGISLNDFYFLNPEINTNCTNLYLNYSYCVQPVGTISTYPGYTDSTATSGDVSNTFFKSLPSVTGSPTPFTALQNATVTSLNVSPTPTATFPLANGTRLDCDQYADNTYGAVSCAYLQQGVPAIDFVSWNPSLSPYNCTLVNQTRYCTVLGEGYITTPYNDTAPDDIPTNAAPNSTSQCWQWYTLQSGDGCASIEYTYNITFQQFYTWNPSIGSNCGTLQPNLAYCVLGTDLTTDPNAPPAPTQSGITSNCTGYYVAQSGDLCQGIADQYGITLSQFLQWNPAVGTDCSKLIAGDAYCIRVPGIGTTPSPTSSIPRTTQTCASAPGPTQTGIPCNCNKFIQQTSGKYCADLASSAGITLDQFYSLNPAVGSSCQYLIAGDYYCVGSPSVGPASSSRSSTTTKTTTSTPPKSTCSTAPGPTQTGMPCNCKKFVQGTQGKYCGDLASGAGISLSQFYAWNPAVGSSCQYLIQGDWYCVSA